MKNSGRCPKCGSMDIVRVPDYLRRYTVNGKYSVPRKS